MLKTFPPLGGMLKTPTGRAAGGVGGRRAPCPSTSQEGGGIIRYISVFSGMGIIPSWIEVER